MKLKLTNPNYCATIVRLDKFVDLANCDNVKGAIIYGQQVIVSKDAKEGDLGLFFPAECQLDDQFLHFNNLYAHENLNADQQQKGYFEDNGRVKTKKFRGHRSEGFFCPLSFLDKFVTDWQSYYNDFREGVSFNQLDYYEVCRKYVRKTNPAPLPKNQKIRKSPTYAEQIVDGQFNFHYDTANLRRNMDSIRPGQVLSVSHKFHGASAIIGRLLIKPELTWKDKIAGWFGYAPKPYYDTVWASRKVVKGIGSKVVSDKPGFYGEDIWRYHASKIGPLLPDGITVYGEIVGWTPSGGEIQKDYTYGLPKGQSEFYCYRITYTNHAGYVVEFTTPQVIEFCDRLGIKTVPVIRKYVELEHSPEEDFTKNVEGFVRHLINVHVDVECHWNKKMPAEGVVLKIEGLNKSRALKLKSFAFLERESKNLDKGVPDMEEEQNVVESVPDNS